MKNIAEPDAAAQTLTRIRGLMWFFIIGPAVNGVTALLLEMELRKSAGINILNRINKA